MSIFVDILVELTNTEYSTNTATNNETAMLFSEENSTLYVFLQLFLKGRLEICQKIYTTEFLGQKFYTLKMRKLRLFLPGMDGEAIFFTGRGRAKSGFAKNLWGGAGKGS